MSATSTAEKSRLPHLHKGAPQATCKIFRNDSMCLCAVCPLLRQGHSTEAACMGGMQCRLRAEHLCHNQHHTKCKSTYLVKHIYSVSDQLQAMLLCQGFFHVLLDLLRQLGVPGDSAREREDPIPLLMRQQ